MAMTDNKNYCVATMLGEPESFDVIVIGGGVSGLRAASELERMHGLKVVVLEAREKIGG